MKRSLHIGLNDYPGTSSDLEGCINDANDWRLKTAKRGKIGWQDFLADTQALHKAIRDAIADIIDASGAQDFALITYSGHGTWTVDESGDEPDGRDEALCPYDLLDAGPLGDDYLGEMFRAKNPDARIVFISDSCHSGSVSRAPVIKDNPFSKGIKSKFLPASYHMKNPDQLVTATKVIDAPIKKTVVPSDILLMSGCADDEYSYDAWFGGRPNGAFTYIALWTLDKLAKDATYEDWYKEIRKYLPNAYYPQTPQLVGSDEQKKWKIFE